MFILSCSNLPIREASSVNSIFSNAVSTVNVVVSFPASNKLIPCVVKVVVQSNPPSSLTEYSKLVIIPEKTS